jgi:hypothetical protein
MGRKCAKRVSLRGSALFKLTSPARLAHILCISPGQLAYLVRNAESNYLVRTDRKTKRLIEEPKALLKQIHARVAHLLQQIETPDYLHSGVRQRSYVTNASQHRADEGAIKLDVRKFFPSARAAAVYAFFHEVMEYPPDVASRMTKLLTIAGHLPTGGNASCILSFWAYRPMFDEIAALAQEQGCAFTLYVDDMTISGGFATRSMQQAARQIIGRHRLRAHKNKVFAPNQPRVVTGVAVTVRGRELPNRRAKAIEELTSTIAELPDERAKLSLLPVLVGRVSEATEIDAAWSRRKDVAVNLRRSLTARSRPDPK